MQMVHMNPHNSSSMNRSYYRNYNMDLEYPRKTYHRERRKTPEMRMTMSCVGYIWTLLSFLSMGLACVGFYLPFWLEGHMRDWAWAHGMTRGVTRDWSLSHEGTQTGTRSFLGVFRRCNYPRLVAEGQIEIVMECGRYAEFWDIPSLWWKVTTVIIGVGCGLSLLVSFTSILSICIEDVISKTIAKVGGLLQFIAGNYKPL